MKAIRFAIFAICLFTAFTACADAESAPIIELPWDLKSIEAQTFYQAEAVTEVILPDNIERIESQAFAHSGLARIALPDSLKYIADDAFSGCADLQAECTEGSYAYD